VNKLKLQIDQLAVESFAVGDADGQIGTVEAREMAPTPPYAGCPALTRLTICPCTPAF
jgi:hypothetical protein